MTAALQDQKSGQIRTRTGDPPQLSPMLSGCDNQLHHMPDGWLGKLCDS